MAESLEAQLQAMLNVIPAYTWYAAPSGALYPISSSRRSRRDAEGLVNLSAHGPSRRGGFSRS